MPGRWGSSAAFRVHSLVDVAWVSPRRGGQFSAAAGARARFQGDRHEDTHTLLTPHRRQSEKQKASWIGGFKLVPMEEVEPRPRAKLGRMGWGFERIFLVRHGKSEWNMKGRRQGQLDSPLTETGRSSVQRVGSMLSELDPDALFSSPLGRAWSTAQIIDAILGLGIQSEVGLSEIDHGELAGRTDDEIERSHPGLLAERRSRLYEWRFPGGESYADGDLRAATALRRIEATST